jgi:hypothetical protein
MSRLCMCDRYRPTMRHMTHYDASAYRGPCFNFRRAARGLRALYGACVMCVMCVMVLCRAAGKIDRPS